LILHGILSESKDIRLLRALPNESTGSWPFEPSSSITQYNTECVYQDSVEVLTINAIADLPVIQNLMVGRHGLGTFTEFYEVYEPLRLKDLHLLLSTPLLSIYIEDKGLLRGGYGYSSSDMNLL
jgi:hypothetical protein